MTDLVKRFGPAAALMVWTLLAAWGGWKTGREQAEARCAAMVATLRADHAQAVAEAHEKAADAQKMGEALAGQQLALEARNAKLGKERDDALRKITTGRACLGADAVRLLNAADTSAPGLRLPAPAGGLAGPPAAPSGDSGDWAPGSWTSDADVALWARFAREQYDLCRGRIDALNDFHGAPNGH
jgi:hypothetical protein